MDLCTRLCCCIAKNSYSPADMCIRNAKLPQQRTYALIVAYITCLIDPTGTNAQISGTQEYVFEHAADLKLLVVVAAFYTCKDRGGGRIHGVSRPIKNLTENTCQLLHVFMSCYNTKVSCMVVKSPRRCKSCVYQLSEDLVAQLLARKGADAGAGK